MGGPINAQDGLQESLIRWQGGKVNETEGEVKFPGSGLSSQGGTVKGTIGLSGNQWYAVVSMRCHHLVEVLHYGHCLLAHPFLHPHGRVAMTETVLRENARTGAASIGGNEPQEGATRRIRCVIS